MSAHSSRPILITGGNGNIGTLVSDQLVSRGHTIVRFDAPGTNPGSEREHEEVVLGDIRDLALIQELLERHRFGVILHFASLLSGSSAADPIAAWEINATASFHLLRLACQYGVSAFFFASTVSTYGMDVEDPLPEEAPQWPDTIYGATKVAVERLGVRFKAIHGIDFRCLRFPMVISPFAPAAARTAYASHAFRAAIRGEPYTFPVSPENGMSTIFIEDVVDGIIRFALGSASENRRPAYNLHGFFVSAQTVADRIVERVPYFQYDFQPDPIVDAELAGRPEVIHDGSARADWGWNPRYDFNRTAKRMFELIGAEEVD